MSTADAPETKRVSDKSRSAAGLVLAFVVCFGIAGAGGLATASSVETWYRTLLKPSWTPPDAVFGPVWTLLYALMAVAAWRVWRAVGWEASRRALGLFTLQLALNLAWSMLFFWQRRIGFGLVDIAALWLAILATILAFRRHDRVAAWLLVPYLLWVSYASALNVALWQLNG